MDSNQRFFASLEMDSKGRVTKVEREDITQLQFLAATSKFGFYLTEPMVLEKIKDVTLSEIHTKLRDDEWYL
ncbi:MAG: hypothetical protein EA384_00290 [Spirochaetaceae bacterium]|nr:MAG: hypothetical protein EA384_00290 [Spirochaetaceae bacterium]